MNSSHLVVGQIKLYLIKGPAWVCFGIATENRLTPPLIFRRVEGRDKLLATTFQLPEEGSPSPMSLFKTISLEIAIPKVASLCPGPVSKTFRSVGSPCPAGQFHCPHHSCPVFSIAHPILSRSGYIHVQGFPNLRTFYSEKEILELGAVRDTSCLQLLATRDVTEMVN